MEFINMIYQICSNDIGSTKENNRLFIPSPADIISYEKVCVFFEMFEKHIMIRKFFKLFINFIIILTIVFVSLALPGCATTNSSILYKDIEAGTAETLSRIKRSFSYKIIESLAEASGHKTSWDKNAEDMKEYLAELRGMLPGLSRSSPSPKHYRRLNISETTINGGSCYTFQPKRGGRTDKAVLWFHGGGNVFEMFWLEWDSAAKIAEKLSVPVIVPLYPVYPETSPEVVLAFLMETYKTALSAYPDVEITILGASAGADLALSLCHYLSAVETGIPFPDKLICVSPAMVAAIDQETLAAMEAIAPYDVLLPMKMVETLRILFDLPEDTINWYSAPLHGDFSKFPPIYLFSGTFEIFYPQMKGFVERVRSQEKVIEFYTGYEMMHCWPFLPFAPECKEAFAMICSIIAG
jgi:acetyl esterase/lipase